LIFLPLKVNPANLHLPDIDSIEISSEGLRAIGPAGWNKSNWFNPHKLGGPSV
jgi:hypothetical protein